MFEQFTFHQIQLEYIKAAMVLFPTYRPFSKTPAQVATMISNCAPVRTAYLAKLDEWRTAQVEARVATEAAHGACVSVYAIMKSVYAPDVTSLELINGLPKRDNSAMQTVERTTAIAARWALLPNPPGSATEFVAGTLTLTEFQALLTTLTTKRAVLSDCDTAYRGKVAALHTCDTENVTFITGALVQGRAQFPPGTEAREVIDSIPTETNTPIPNQALINVATSPASGAVHLEFTSAHATSFQVWHKGPGETVFSQIAESPVPGVYDVTGLVAGEHAYEIVGVNSRGEGEASLPSVVAVAGEVPSAAGIFSAESPSAGSVHLYYGADGATSYQVWHKGPGESSFSQVDTTLTGEYLAFDLPGGMHAYKVVGVNLSGTGPASAPSTIDVAAEAVA